MTTLQWKPLTMPSVELNGESSLPLLSGFPDTPRLPPVALDEDDELFVGYEFVNSAFPFRAQDRYSRELKPVTWQTAVLENAFLRAVFVPALGGRLWSLFDKQAGKELLFANPVFRPANLAVRNAWFSGGVEWNCGIWGHHPLTCSPLFCASLHAPDGTPVLRMYEFERIRGVTYQMDFSLPEGSRFLYARMRVVNSSEKAVSMYWWSNIAVPEKPGARVIVEADEAYTARGGTLHKEAIPLQNGTDISYPVNLRDSVDYFWKIPPAERKYICQLDEIGYGLVQTSTARLKGRKMFVWGQGRGGQHWQEYLSGNSCDGRYCEIQAGLAHSQYEGIPMPPKTAWEWEEAYGAMQADPVRTHGAWAQARREVREKLEAVLPAQALEQQLRDSHTLALTRADTLQQHGSGWGALENERRRCMGEPPLPEHLDFGSMSAEQEPWRFLLHNGCLPPAEATCPPVSWMRQAEWRTLLEQAVKGPDRFYWMTHLQLGCAYLADGRFNEAERELSASLTLQHTAWGLSCMAELCKLRGDDAGFASHALAAARCCPEDASLVRMAAFSLFRASRFDALYAYISDLPQPMQDLPRIRLYRAYAAVHTGQLEIAEALLCRAGEWLKVPDVKEGEISLSELWYQLQEQKAARDGGTFDRTAVDPPRALDFRALLQS